MSGCARVNEGAATQPSSDSGPASTRARRIAAPKSGPRSLAIRASSAASLPAAATSSFVRPSCTSANATSGCAIARLRTTASQRAYSVRGVRMNLRLAGTL